MNPLKGATPVPGPTIIIGTCGLVGSLNWDFLMKMGTVTGASFSADGIFSLSHVVATPEANRHFRTPWDPQDALDYLYLLVLWGSDILQQPRWHEHCLDALWGRRRLSNSEAGVLAATHKDGPARVYTRVSLLGCEQCCDYLRWSTSGIALFLQGNKSFSFAIMSWARSLTFRACAGHQFQFLFFGGIRAVFGQLFQNVSSGILRDVQIVSQRGPVTAWTRERVFFARFFVGVD